MKANAAQTARALDAPPADIRLFLLHGPDEPEARALANRLDRAMGAGAERIDLDGTMLKADPARLADEAASLSLFGERRHIRVSPAGDEILPAVAALLSSEGAANPVVVLGGALKPSSALLKLALANPAIMACACYPPSDEDAVRIAAALAHEAGLRLGPDVARHLVHAAGNDRNIVAREVEKLALFLDAAPDRPREADMDAVGSIGAGEGEANLSRLVDAVLEGHPAIAAAEAERLAEEGIEGIALVRALARRVQLLNKLAPQVASGTPASQVVEAQGKSIFWKEKGPITRQLGKWPPERLATATNRLLAAERAVKGRASAGPILVASELIQISRAAGRGR